MKLNSFCFLIIFLLAFFFSAKSQEIHFRHLTIDNGLSQNAVPSIIQDRQGFMWFGTKDGLNRYNGYSFAIYQNDPFDTTTIPSNYVTALFLDKHSILWIGGKDGSLSYLKAGNEYFNRINYQQDSSDNQENSSINCIAEDSSGNIWIGTNGNGLFRLSFPDEKRSKMKFKQFINDPEESTSLGYNNISSLLFDSFGTLWIGTSLTLEKYNSADENFKHYTITVKSKEAPSLLSENEVSAIYEDKSGEFWLGTLSGLVSFNRKSGDYNLFPHHYIISRFGWGRISNILEDDSGLLWLATPGGLMIFDNIKKSYNYYMNDPLDPSSISYNSVSSVWRDRTGILWLGTPGAGINIYDPNKNRFSTFIRKKDEKSRITGFSVRAILEDNKGYVWISTDVLYRWNRRTGELKSYETSSDHPDDFGNTGARSIIQSVKGDLWFATPQGLFNYNPINEKSRQYKFDPMNTDGLPQREVFAVYEDHKGDIWIATENYFCKLTDYKKGTFKTFRYNKNIPKNEIAQVCIYEDTKSVFWIGTNDGLIRFVQSTGTFLKYRNDPSDPSSLNNNNIKSICPDPSEPEKFLWLGTAGGGLNKFNYKNKTFTHFTTKDNLPNNVVYGILPDEKGNLWLSTNRGLSMFNPSQPRFRNYDVLDGLQSNEFNTGAYFRTNRGELFFGGINGFNHFFPKNIKDNRVIPNIVITRCIILSQSSSNTNENAEEIKSVLNKKSITLSYNENIFSFNFAAMDFSAPEKNRFAYKLENFNENWINIGTSNTATFTDLPPGKYVFRVKGSNNDGVWNNEGASLELIILPHGGEHGGHFLYTDCFLYQDFIPCEGMS